MNENWTYLHSLVLHLPILTTVVAAVFCFELFHRLREKGGGRHLLWWGIGMLTYGLGTLTEASTTLFGWHPLVFRSWYVAGAFLGGYPLAQGSIYLLMSKRFADRSAWIVCTLIGLASIAVFASPLDLAQVETHRLSGAVLEWEWVRLISPFINLYAAAFLIGGAVVSALRFRRGPGLRHRYVGNVLIAIGALLPGIGGTMTRAGFVEALYVTELVGLVLIYAGYRKCVAAPAPVAERSAVLAPGRAGVLLLAGLLLAAPTAVAAEGSAEDPATEAADAESEQLAEMESFFDTTTVTATGSERRSFEVSTPVSVLRSEEIERKASENPAALLREQPGVDVNGVGPNQMRPVIRGQRGLRVLFLENGLRMNNPRRQTDFGEIPGLVELESVSAVEVVRGPASVLYGSDAIGGVLNLITRSPGFGAGTLRGSAALRFGSAGDLWKGSASAERRGERFSLRLGGSYRDAEDYDAPAGTFGAIRLDRDAPVVDSGVQDESLYGGLGWALGDSRELVARFNRYRADRTGFGFIEPDRLGAEEPFRIRILYPFQEFDRFSLSYVASALGGGVADSLEAQAYYQVNERQLVNDIDINIGPLFPGAPDSSVAADTRNFTDLETLGARFEAIKVLGGDDHLLTWGGELYRDDSTNTDFSETVTTLRFPFPPFAVVSRSTDAVANTPNAVNESWGLFVQDEMALGERLRLTLGARLQNVSTRAEPTPGWQIAGLDFDDDSVVGAVNLVYRASDNLRLVGSYGTAFRAPNIVERLFNGPTPEGAGFQILNPELTAEESENVEFGLKYLRPNAVFELVVFRNDIDKGVIQYFLSPAEIALLPPATQAAIRASRVQFVVQQRNIDRLRWEGVEAVVGYRWQNGVTVGANYTHLDGKRVDSTNPPTGDSVSEKVNLRLAWEPRDSRWWLEYRLRHNGSQPANLQANEPVPPVGEVLPSFTVHSLSGGWTFFERAAASHAVTLHLDNLSDELYAEFSNATFFRPQPGRSATLGYRASF